MDTPTIYDVSRLSGVSTATVSRAFTAPDRVREETRRKVLAAAEALGYQPSAIARAMARQQTDKIAFLICKKDATILDEFYASICEGVMRRANSTSYQLLISTAADWQQGRCPQRRRGRIALLPPDKWCSYMENHLRIVTEGLVEGDRWHLICVQEGVLFSYLEEPRTNVNIRHKPGAHSPELDAWIAADPESHFARFTPEQKAHPDSGHNFVFLPRIAGTED